MDTLLIEFDQQAFEAYLSSGSETTVAECTCRADMTESPVLSPTHVAKLGHAKQSPEAAKAPRRDYPQMVGNPSYLVKRNRNAERCQCRRERRQQEIAAINPSSPLDLSYISYDKCVSAV